MPALGEDIEKEFEDGGSQNKISSSLLLGNCQVERLSTHSGTASHLQIKREGKERERGEHRCEFWVMPSGSPMDPVAMATHSCDGPLWELGVKNCREASQKQ